MGFALVAFADALKRGVMHWFSFDAKTMWGESQERDKPHRAGTAQTHEFLFDASSNALRCRRCTAIPSQGQQCPVKAPYTARHCLQQLAEAARKIDYNVWVNKTLEDIHFLQRGYSYDRTRGALPGDAVRGAVISDLRYPNEIEGLRRMGAFLIRVVRTIDDEVPDRSVLHDSETALLDVPDDGFDYVLKNKTPGGTRNEIVKIVSGLTPVLTKPALVDTTAP